MKNIGLWALVMCLCILMAEVMSMTAFPSKNVTRDIFGRSSKPSSPIPRSRLSPVGGDPRILVVGDSITFGWGVDETEAYPYQLQRLMSGDFPNVRVFNAGLSGYDTLDEYRLAKDVIPKIQPDIVLIGFFGRNDLYPDGANDLASNSRPAQSPGGWVIGPPRSAFLRRHSHLYGFLARQFRRLLAFRKKVRKEAFWSNSADIETAWKKTFELFDGIAGEAGKIGARTYVVYLPMPESVLSGDDTTEKKLRKSKLEIISTYSSLRALAAKDIDSYVIEKNDIHWNGRAYSAIAQVIADHVSVDELQKHNGVGNATG